MGCSASRLRRTRSGTVNPFFLAAAFLAECFLDLDKAGLSPAAPIPPLALRGREKRIAGLGNGGGENILAADIDALAGGAAKFQIKLCRILTGKMLYAANAKKLKIAEHGWSDGNQVL
jgi:hypothetical protein